MFAGFGRVGQLVMPMEAPEGSVAVRCTLTGEGPPHIEQGSPFSQLDDIAFRDGALLYAGGPKADARMAGAMAERGLKEALIAPLHRVTPAPATCW